MIENSRPDVKPMSKHDALAMSLRDHGWEITAHGHDRSYQRWVPEQERRDRIQMSVVVPMDPSAADYDEMIDIAHSAMVAVGRRLPFPYEHGSPDPPDHEYAWRDLRTAFRSAQTLQTTLDEMGLGPESEASETWSLITAAVHALDVAHASFIRECPALESKHGAVD